MTTYFRTLLLLGFTGLVTSSAGCILETTSGGNASNCSIERYFQVYWSIDNGAGTTPLTCAQPPAPTSHVELVTNNGPYVVGKECAATQYMTFVFDWRGSTVDGIAAGTYVTTANLVSDTDNSVLSSAPGAGPAYALQSCAPTIVAYPFSLQ